MSPIIDTLHQRARSLIHRYYFYCMFDVQKEFSELFDCLRIQIISYRVDYSGTLLELPYLNINKHSVCPYQKILLYATYPVVMLGDNSVIMPLIQLAGKF
jgi:hypothetical protein